MPRVSKTSDCPKRKGQLLNKSVGSLGRDVDCRRDEVKSGVAIWKVDAWSISKLLLRNESWPPRALLLIEVGKDWCCRGSVDIWSVVVVGAPGRDAIGDTEDSGNDVPMAGPEPEDGGLC